MAITSFPFDGQDTDENQFSLLFRELQDSGIADTHGGNGLIVAASTGMAVTVQPGLALLRGFAMSSSAVETRTIPNSTTGTVIHRVILRLDPTTNTIGIEVISGAPGGAAPVLNQTANGIFEIPLARITVPTGTSNLAASMIVDDRDFLGSRVGAWTTEKRPASPRKGRTGYNVSLGYVEFFDGSQWTPVANQGRVGDISMSAVAAVPPTHLVCDGTEHPNSAYPALAAAIGTMYGGTPGTSFRVPNFKGAFPTQAYGNEANALGKSGGSATKTLAVTNLPAHDHDIDHDHGTTPSGGAHAHGHRTSDRDGAAGSVMKTGSAANDTLFSGTGGVTNAESQHTHRIPPHNGKSGKVGSGAAFDVMNPWTAINILIKAV